MALALALAPAAPPPEARAPAREPAQAPARAQTRPTLSRREGRGALTPTLGALLVRTATLKNQQWNQQQMMTQIQTCQIRQTTSQQVNQQQAVTNQQTEAKENHSYICLED